MEALRSLTPVQPPAGGRSRKKKSKETQLGAEVRKEVGEPALPLLCLLLASCLPLSRVCQCTVGMSVVSPNEPVNC